MDEADLYDEFGNYIGPELGDSDSDSGSDSAKTPAAATSRQHGSPEAELPGSSPMAIENGGDTNGNPSSQAIVLAEDQEYYPSASAVFGPDTEVLIEEEDAQPITQPIVEPKVEFSSSFSESKESEPVPKYSLEYLAAGVLSVPALVRNIAFIGGLHHGKTCIADMLFEASHDMKWENLREQDLPVRYMDTRKDEQRLQISLKATAATMLLQTRAGKSYGFTIVDTPGHLNFMDEAIAAMNLVDGAVVVVDVAEGLTLSAELLLKKAASLRLDIVLVVSKIDRLISELRLPPPDAYHKIRDVIDHVNEVLSPHGVRTLSPAKGNVAFSASNEKVVFTLQQFAEEYVIANSVEQEFPMSSETLAKCLWGDIYFSASDRTFSRRNRMGAGKRSFVQFVLEPLYKLHSVVVGTDVEELTALLSRNHLLDEGRKKEQSLYRGRVQKGALKEDVNELLRSVNSRAFGMGSISGFVDMVVSFVSSPEDANERKLENLTAKLQVSNANFEASAEGNNSSFEGWVQAMSECSIERSSPMTAYVGKLVPDANDDQFDAMARIMSGEIRTGDKVRVLGHDYDPDFNDEDQAVASVQQMFLSLSRFSIPVSRAVAGQIVLLRGMADSIGKSSTIVCQRSLHSSHARIMKPLTELLTPGVVKIAVEPVRPAELPRMVSGIRKCMQAFPSLQSRVEQSGEHTLIGSGELYMDCVLRDLRENYGKVEVKVSDPVVPFAETVTDASKLHCYADTPNGLNRITMIAEPLEDDFLEALQSGQLSHERHEKKSLPKRLEAFGWDLFAARSLWAFGPHPQRGPNVLLNDITDPEARANAAKIRSSIEQGFSWATREGPLTDEAVRGLKFRILDVSVAEAAIGRSPAQVIPASRRVCYSAFLTAAPRLSEPMYLVEIVCPPEALDIARTFASRRRANVISNTPLPGTPLVALRLEMPVLDSFGFEPDLRNLTHGIAFCMMTFSHWAVVPGDPLDKTVVLKPLEPAGRRELARECMVKTRRRKGMPDDVSITKYFDDPLLIELATEDEELMQLL